MTIRQIWRRLVTWGITKRTIKWAMVYVVLKWVLAFTLIAYLTRIDKWKPIYWVLFFVAGAVLFYFFGRKKNTVR
jgi:hypothetical protein